MTVFIWFLCNGYSAHEKRRCYSSRIFFFFLLHSCTAQSHLALSHRTGWHRMLLCKNNRVCPLQAACYWLLSNWDAWQVWRCNLEHSSLGLRDSHRSTVICLLNTAPDWQWALENYVLINDAEKSKMIKSGCQDIMRPAVQGWQTCHLFCVQWVKLFLRDLHYTFQFILHLFTIMHILE